MEIKKLYEKNESERNRMNVDVKRVLEVIKHGLKLNENIEIDLDSNLEELGMDSIAFIQTVVFAEKEFDIEFDDEKLDAGLFLICRDFFEYIQKKLEDSK